jgi:hypothetical protein
VLDWAESWEARLASAWTEGRMELEVGGLVSPTSEVPVVDGCLSKRFSMSGGMTGARASPPPFSTSGACHASCPSAW